MQMKVSIGWSGTDPCDWRRRDFTRVIEVQTLGRQLVIMYYNDQNEIVSESFDECLCEEVKIEFIK